MRVWTFCIAADQESPPLGSGYVLAPNAHEALAIVGHPDTNVYPLPKDANWPGGANRVIHWDRQSISVF